MTISNADLAEVFKRLGDLLASSGTVVTPPPAPLPTLPAPTPEALTPLQQQSLTTIKGLIRSWCKPSFVMAHISVESAWNPTVVSSDGLGSVGLMQVLPGTAQEMLGRDLNQAIPYNSILAGIRYMNQCKTILEQHLIMDYQPEAYNVGAVGYCNGRRNAAYLRMWTMAQHGFAFVDG